MINGNPMKTTITVRRSLFLLIVKIVITELIFEFTYIGWRLLIDLNILQFSQESLLIIHSFSIFIFFILITVVQTSIILFILLDWINRYYEIKPDEIVFKTGIISSQEKAYPYVNIQSIEVIQNFWGKLFNYGNVRIYIPTLGHDLFFTEVSKPNEFAELIKQMLPDKDKSGQFLFKREGQK